MGGFGVAFAELTKPPRAPGSVGAGRPPGACSGFALETWRVWLVSYGVLSALTVGAAALVLIVPGGPALARETLRLSLSAAHNPPPSLGGVVSIAVNNTLHSVWPLSLRLIDVQRRRVSRLLADAAVLGNLLVCGLLVGAALGGYGWRVLAFLPHVPLEWAGVSLGTAGWAMERRQALGARERKLTVALTAGLLVCAALVESLLVPHR